MCDSTHSISNNGFSTEVPTLGYNVSKFIQEINSSLKINGHLAAKYLLYWAPELTLTVNEQNNSEMNEKLPPT